MKIYGLQKTSLLDYPEHISSIIFTGGCNFNCPYCQNSELLHPENNLQNEQAQHNERSKYTGQVSQIPQEEILAFLKKRAGILEGVVITGGEPTLHADLPDFIQQIRQFHLKIKLDTNGSNPQMLQYLLEDQLLDYLAMDVKASPQHYAAAAGLSTKASAVSTKTPSLSTDFLDKIQRSIALIQNSHLSYEFRTTVVLELHTLPAFHQLGELIRGAKLCYLQTFRDCETVSVAGLHPFSEEDMKKAAEILRLYVQEVRIR